MMKILVTGGAGRNLLGHKRIFPPPVLCVLFPLRCRSADKAKSHTGY